VGVAIEPGTAFAFGRYRLYPQSRLLLADERPVELKSRAFEAALALVEACGELVTKEQLRERLWPNTFVDPHNLDQQISTLRKALGEDKHLIRTETGRGWRLAAAVRLIPTSPQTQPATNLPPAVTPLIGRENELSKLPELIAEHRLVTLTGPGGIGKTQLGLEAARHVLTCFPDGVWISELAPMTDPELIPGTIARALGITPGPNRSLLDQIVAVLHRKRVLLVIDNCEHLIEATTQATEALLRGAAELHILATSREPLEAEGERVFRVDPLSVPPRDSDHIDEALRHSAVRLFVERAQAADRNFVLDARTAPDVAKICRHLDGVPLALELAAGCVPTIGVKVLANRLHDRFRLLAGGRRCALPRQQTLAATLEWSYGLLTHPERAVLRRIAIFAGSFTLDGACATAASDDIDTSEAANHIMRLIRKSLVALDVRRSTRYRLLDTTRAYARQKLAESGEYETVARRHADHCREMLDQAQTSCRTASASEIVAEYAPEIDDLRAAIHWSLEPGGDTELGVELTAAAVPLWTFLSILGECRTLIERALSALRTLPDHQSHDEMVLHAALGRASMWAKGPGAEAYSAATRAHDLAECIGDREYQLDALYALWIIQLRLGEYRSSLMIAKRFRAVADQAGDIPAVLTGGRIEGVSLSYLGDYPEALTAFRQVVDRMYSDAHQSFMVRFGFDQCVGVRACTARILWLQGFPDQAKRVAAEAVEEARSLNHANSLCFALSFGACSVATLSADVAAVERFSPMIFEIAEQHGLGMWMGDCHAFQGWIAVRRGDIENGLRLLSAALGNTQQPRVELHQTVFAGTFAEALADAGRVDDALIAIGGALTDSMRHEGYWCVPELLRLRADLTHRRADASNRFGAEKDLRDAITLAASHGARSWQLRAATSLARFLRDQRRLSEARDVLLPIYESFTEGFDTADLKAAQVTVNELQ
jgi:predicted ATPase/DNA-binding winged helix-turn-helix (wHTH) protein